MVSMSAVWDRTTAFLGDNAAPVAAIAVPAIFVPNAVEGIVQPLSATLPPLGRLGLGLLILALSLVSLWGQLALVALALDPLVTHRQALARASNRFGAAFGVAALLLAVLVALGLPVIAIMVAHGVDPGSLSGDTRAEIPPGAGLWTALYLLILLPLLLWAFARLLPLSAVVVAERRGVGAIGRAFSLTRGTTWRIVGVAVLYGIVAGVATLAAKTVFGSILRLAFGDSGGVSAAGVVTAVVVAAVSTVFSAIACAFVAKLYLALRARSDGAVLALAEVAPAADIAPA